MDGDENFHLYLVDIGTNEVRDITPFEGVRAQMVALESSVPDVILVGLNKRDPRQHDVYRIHLITGQVELDTENPGSVIAWTADSRLQVRAALSSRPDGGTDLWQRRSSEAPWQTIIQWDPDDQGAPVHFSEDGRTLYLLGSHGVNAQRLLAREADTGQEKVLAEDPEYDVSAVLVHPARHVIQAVAFYRDKMQWQALDPEIAPDLERLATAHPGEMTISRQDLRDQLWLVAYAVDNGPVTYYLYDRLMRELTFLFSQRPALEKYGLAWIDPITLPARDGLTLHGYLTLPVGLPAKNLPTVLLVHGGPWGRDHWGFNTMAQWLANRGYAVLQVNFRGSTGYGKKFLNAGNREWAGKMHDDLIDGVRWLIQKEIADPKRVAIMGASFGGYATLVGLTFTPDVFCCGVDIVGPSNLITLIQTIPPYWGPLKAIFARRVGIVEQDEAFIKSRSPLFFVDRIVVPLLIAQGANDPRVKRAESDQIVEAMRKNGKPVEYLVYADEGHGFARPANRRHFYGRAEAFLAKYLGGRVEPEDDIQGHSAEVR
jgi:dienelactone hydrolase